MKTKRCFGFLACLTALLVAGQVRTIEAAGASDISPTAGEVVKLAGSGVGEDVVLAYIHNSTATFNLTADQVLYLKDVGLPSPVITAMLEHDTMLRSQAPANPQPQYAPAPQGPATPSQPEMAAAPPPAPAPQPTYVTSAPPEVGYFYNDLAPYGSWVDLAGVGWCWQPSTVVVTHGWRPYCDGGHWVWSDAGWFWQSEYSWGWAPFHYGRWHMDARCGWVWLPGTVWGPAWVTWRTAGTTCGWAPLPPHADFVAGVGWRYNGVTVGASFDFGLGVNAFAFVSFGNLCANNVSYHCLPPAQVTTIYKQTTVVNNYVVNNNTYVNRGIAYDRIAAASHTPIPRATLHEGHGGAGGSAGAAGGNVVYRTPIHAPEKPVHMQAQKVEYGHSIQHNSAIAASRVDSPLSSTSTRFQNPQYNTLKGQQTIPSGNNSKSPAGTTSTYQWQNGQKTGPTYKSPAGSPTYVPNSQQNYKGALGGGTAGSGQSTVGTGTSGGVIHSTGTGNQTLQKGGGSPLHSGESQNPRFYTPKTIDQTIETQPMSRSDRPQGNSPLHSSPNNTGSSTKQ